MNLKEQTYICTLARWGTISRAAEELHLTAPALSMFLSTLEKNLDVRLFRRTGKTLEPTAIGREYIRIAEKMLLLKEELKRFVSLPQRLRVMPSRCYKKTTRPKPFTAILPRSQLMKFPTLTFCVPAFLVKHSVLLERDRDLPTHAVQCSLKLNVFYGTKSHRVLSLKTWKDWSTTMVDARSK